MRGDDFGFTALKVVGGLLPAEFLAKIAALDAGDQDNAAYGLTKSLSLRDEIGRHWRIAVDLWSDFRGQASDRWLPAFLAQALTFSDLQLLGGPIILGERCYPVTHRACKGAVAIALVPSSCDLDRSDAAFGEDGRRRSPFWLVQEYLNAAEEVAWGIVANGTLLRVLRDNPSLTRTAYIEIDLERMFEDQIFADFAAFWLLAHASRFQPREPGKPTSCIFERWRDKALETGERFKDLRKGVTEALLTLGQGFLAHPANEDLRAALTSGRLDAAGLHQQLLRLVYRLLFLFTIEDRGLLHPPDATDGAKALYREGYGAANLRTRSLRSLAFDKHGDLWQGLGITFLALERGAPEIAAPALGGLFDRGQCPDLFAARLANADLLTAIKALAFFRSGKALARVNYRDMNTEEFGSVYESLLELHPVIETTPWRFGYVGLNGGGATGSERKLSGSYYTPSALVLELIRSALEPVIRETTARHPYDQRGALLGLKILDPACGSGHFLLAAARRLATEVARLDAAPDPPTEAQHQHALRDVVRHCIYGVDKNPLAVELCKTALWIETVEPGKPLSFLDHHVKCGDSLIGVFDLKVLEDGIPDEAFKAKTGDDTARARDLKRRNADERKGQHTFAFTGAAEVAAIAGQVAAKARAIEDLPEDELDCVIVKAKRYRRCQLEDPDLQRLRLACDLWTAAFFANLRKPKPGEPERVPTTDSVVRALAGQPVPPPVVAAADELAHRHAFFHWPLQFPDVFKAGGFDVVLGNPPWERIKLQEQEFFAERDPAIANAPNKAEREKRIKALKAAGPDTGESRLHADFEAAKHAADAAGVFIREAGRFPLTATGDINTYAIFAETFMKLIGAKGRAGIIVPTGIATDNTTKAFFDHLISGQRLVSLFDFENSTGIFPSVHRSYKFCLLTVGGGAEAAFSFFATRIDHLTDPNRRFTLTADDIALINPNTRTCPIFRTSYDAEVTKTIYQRVPVLIDEAKDEAGNPWSVRFMAMFHMANDSGLFRTQGRLAAVGGALQANRSWTLQDGTRWLALYEAKMIHHYDHRWATYETDGEAARDVTETERRDPAFAPMPRYWVTQAEVEARLKAKGWNRGWLMGWRDICRATDERTVIASALPRWGVNHKMPLFFVDRPLTETSALYANLCSLILDFIARQKVGGTSLTFFILKQLPLLSPSSYSAADLAFIVPRVLELTYTAWDMQPFAEDLGYDGTPFAYDPQRRALLRGELDAYYAHLYGLSRDELRYILDPADVKGEDWPSETFRVLKTREIKELGEYRTRRLVLEAWDRFSRDGTFDPAAKAERAERKAEFDAQLAKIEAPAQTSLFVEGKDDARILTAAWGVLFSGSPMPFALIAAGGCDKMKGLAYPERDWQIWLNHRLVMALCDNDGEGRALWNDGHLHKGGKCKRQTNGVWWCLLPPTGEFRAVMSRFTIDAAFWPFTIENAFPAALRVQAMAEGAYALDTAPMADLLTEQRISKPIVQALATLPDDDPTHLYLRRPTPDAKDRFAAWVTAPERLTVANYAAFTPVLTRFKQLLEREAARMSAP